MAGVEAELTDLLRPGGDKKDKKPLIECSQLVDGVVTFESEQDAEEYGRLLEESNMAHGVVVARCDSHALFREVQTVKGVVILVKRGGQRVDEGDGRIPAPYQLSAAVRGPPSPLSSVDFDD